MAIDWGAGMVQFCFTFVNLSLATGLIFGAMLLLRPATTRLLTPQQRSVLWGIGWLPAYLASWYGFLSIFHFLPITFRDLITPRVEHNGVYSVPDYLPGDYHGPGAYNIALPGGAFVEVEFNQVLVTALVVLWLAGTVAVIVIFQRRDRELRRLIAQGEIVSPLEPWLKDALVDEDGDVRVRLCDGLPTSFLYWGKIKGDKGIRYTVCLQRELSLERRKLVLLHELKHRDLRHVHLKCYANAGLLFHWWNPLMWLSHKYFCRDLELACDRAMMKKLDAAERRDYARTLVELGVGRQLWDAPLCFGECDAALRVKAIVAWKEPGVWRSLASMLAFTALMLFFLGGPLERSLPQDVLLTWEKNGGTAQTLVMDARNVMRTKDMLPDGVEVIRLWIAPSEYLEDYDVSLFAELSDGGWREVKGSWIRERDYLELYVAYGMERPPNLIGALELT